MTKTVLFTAVLLTMPALAMAECNWSKQHQAMSCAEGTKYDADSGTCVSLNA